MRTDIMRSDIAIRALAAAALLFPLVAPPPAAADGDEPRVVHRHVVRHYRLPPERHVLEAVRPPGSPNFQINDHMFLAQTPACFRWLPGDRIRLLAGDWNGYCTEAVFYNLRQRTTCTLACSGSWTYPWR
jgi:hypothetical protein